MRTLAIEINDCGLQVMWSGPSPEPMVPPSPGYALLEAGQIVTGRQAAACARLKPRLIHHRFWSALDRSPLAPPLPVDLSSADLAHAHLSHVWHATGQRADGVILIVPGSWSRPQMALALGVARAAGLPVNGLVEASVAAAAGRLTAPQQIHLDLQLHRVVASQLQLEGDLTRLRVSSTERLGLVEFHDRWARAIAALFIQETRFDPLHAAASEQDLYAQLPGLGLQLAADGETVLQMESAGKRHTVSIKEQTLVQAVSGYQEIIGLLRPLLEAAPQAGLLLSHRVAQLPGLTPLLAQQLKVQPLALPATAALNGCLLNRQLIQTDDAALPLISHLPPTPIPTAPAPTRSPEPLPAPGPPTHLLYRGQAYAITEMPLLLGSELPKETHGLRLPGGDTGLTAIHCSLRRVRGGVKVEIHGGGQTFLNGKPIKGRFHVSTGDDLRLGNPGVAIALIEVIP